MRRTAPIRRIFSASLLCFSCILALTATSCDPDDDDDNPTNTCQPAGFETQTATGEFMNEPFTFVAGKAKTDPFDSTEFRITFYGETPTGDMCDNFNFDLPEKSIIMVLPKAVGVYNLGSQRGVTFNHALPNETNAAVATCGSVEIVSINATTVVCRIDANARDGENMLNGDFTVQLCPE